MGAKYANRESFNKILSSIATQRECETVSIQERLPSIFIANKDGERIAITGDKINRVRFIAYDEYEKVAGYYIPWFAQKIARGEVLKQTGSQNTSYIFALINKVLVTNV